MKPAHNQEESSRYARLYPWEFYALDPETQSAEAREEYGREQQRRCSREYFASLDEWEFKQLAEHGVPAEALEAYQEEEAQRSPLDPVTVGGDRGAAIDPTGFDGTVRYSPGVAFILTALGLFFTLGGLSGSNPVGIICGPIMVVGGLFMLGKKALRVNLVARTVTRYALVGPIRSTKPFTAIAVRNGGLLYTTPKGKQVYVGRANFRKEDWQRLLALVERDGANEAGQGESAPSPISSTVMRP